MSHRCLTLPRALAPAFFSLLTLAATPLAAQELVPFLTFQIELERELLADDLRQYGEVRDAQRTAAEEVETSLTALDDALEAGTVTLGQLEGLESEIQEAEERLAVLKKQSAEVRRRIFDSLRRTALLGDRLDGLRRSTRVRLDPVTGVWEVQIRPGRQVARMRLTLDGTILNGTYTYEDGSAAGSFRGTFAGDRIQMERIDSRRGFDSVWIGEVDPVRRELRGTWTATELSSGLAAAGTWSAKRIDPDEDENDEGAASSDGSSTGGENL